MNYNFYGVDTVYLAKKYGTPLYVMSEDYIIERCEEIKKDFLNKYENTFAVYAGKAFNTKTMCRIIAKEGLGLDVVSGGELFTALSVNFPSQKIIFHGNNKSLDELTLAIDNNVGRIVVDNISELEQIIELSKLKSKITKILFRITPGVDSHTHSYISTGDINSKFGISLNEEILYKAIKIATDSEFINLAGFHFHVGSQLDNNDSHLKATTILLNTMQKAKNDLNFTTKELNVGGGFGIKYADSNNRKNISYFTDAIMELIKTGTNDKNLDMPLVIIEPGRWIVGESGITIYEIGNIKNAPGLSTYAGINGGMPDNPRPALYQAKYEALIANKSNIEKNEIVTIAGKCCESGDILIKDLEVPQVKKGDLLVVKSTGAYNYSMSNNYNKLPIPAVVMIKNGEDRIIVKRQSYEEMINREI
ncbi:diaminopimelate decarboxylase [Helicovermis profundi]|uniref:Diaminopimelate decarboxylase n=1 Tax=Helicovermis profundi TaxID=3065157 RepID=A0AAU9EU97_9FIRM|nr:diaminopimelate decarboxylase [Clostridia bacterium S502]